MKLLPLTISVKRSRFRRDDPASEHSDKDFVKKREQILERDQYTCRFCGFQSSKYQEVHHLNDNHSDNSDNNLVTACPLCHSVFHIGFSGLQKKGIMISLNPALGITQGELNQIVRALWIAEDSGHKESIIYAQDYLARLMTASTFANRIIGTVDPLVLANELLYLDDTTYMNRSQLLSGIYYLPHKEKYKAAYVHWKKEWHSTVPASKWSEMALSSIDKHIANQWPDLDKTIARSNFINTPLTKLTGK